MANKISASGTGRVTTEIPALSAVNVVNKESKQSGRLFGDSKLMRDNFGAEWRTKISASGTGRVTTEIPTLSAEELRYEAESAMQLSKKALHGFEKVASNFVT